MDAPTARALYALIRERLPHTALISIAHNSEIAEFHDRRITLTPAAEGSTVTTT